MMSFRKLHAFARYDELGQLSKTFVSINDPTTNDTISAELVGDWRHENEAATVDAVLDAFFKKHFADKAMAESVQKVDEMDKLLARTRQEMAELQSKAMAEMKAETERNREMLKIAFMTLNAMMAGDEEDDEDFDDVEDSEEELN